jgi:hypothetical protein
VGGLLKGDSESECPNTGLKDEMQVGEEAWLPINSGIGRYWPYQRHPINTLNINILYNAKKEIFIAHETFYLKVCL